MHDLLSTHNAASISYDFTLISKQGKLNRKSYLEPSVILVDSGSKLDSLSFANKGPQLWVVIQTEVVSHKIPVETVASPLLLLVQQVRGCSQAETEQPYEYVISCCSQKETKNCRINLSTLGDVCVHVCECV